MEGKKGFWDILSIIFTMLVPIVGGVFTWVYNIQQNEYNKLQDEHNNIIKQQEIQISKIQALEKFLPYIKKDADSGQQEAAIAVIYLLGYHDIAVKLAGLNPTKGSVYALTSLGVAEQKNIESVVSTLQTLKDNATAEDETRKLASKALDDIQKSQSSKAGKWAIVIGSDATLQDAEDELKRAKKLNYGSVIIYHRQDSFRTAIAFGTKDEAQTKLAEVRAKIRDSSYMVALDRWCPNPVGQENGRYFECAGT